MFILKRGRNEILSDSEENFFINQINTSEMYNFFKGTLFYELIY